jgi:hypothetical protein
MFRRCVPAFLRLAAKSPELWSESSNLVISEAVRSKHYEIKKFVLHDTITALVLGTPPLIHYNTSSAWVDEGQHDPHLEWVYGVSAGVIVQIAKINSWRVSRLMDQAASDQIEWREIEARLKQWNPTIDYTFESSDAITKVTVQEAWRQAVLIYLYMVCWSFCYSVLFFLDKPVLHSVCVK